MWIGSARAQVVREDGRRPDEHLIVQGDSGVDGDVVLDLAAVADAHPGVDEDVLADGAAGADHCARAHVRLVPDPAASADRRAGLHLGGGGDLRWERPLAGVVCGLALPLAARLAGVVCWVGLPLAAHLAEMVCWVDLRGGSRVRAHDTSVAAWPRSVRRAGETGRQQGAQRGPGRRAANQGARRRVEDQRGPETGRREWTVPPAVQPPPVAHQQLPQERGGVGGAAAVGRHRLRNVAQREAGVPGPQREVGLLGIQEERVVPASEALRALRGHQQAGAGGPVGDPSRAVRHRIGHHLAQPGEPARAQPA